jgi:phosphomannomutase
MSLKFGTSGLRGLETELTDEACIQFTRAFLRHFRSITSKDYIGTNCLLAGDLRRSTPRIKAAVAKAIVLEGLEPLDCGEVPTPALAYECQQRNAPGVMITGSHIPADRNGLKFYLPGGEILKSDEVAILEIEAKLAAERQAAHKLDRPLMPKSVDAKISFIKRYTAFFPNNLLSNTTIVFYEHSSVARETFPRILELLGAKVNRYKRSSEFIPVDTEALESVQQLAEKVRGQKAFALISTDGDGDRPLLIDELGQVVRGDQIGILAALELQADSVSTPISSTTGLEETLAFRNIRRCKIGSPFVIAEMNEAQTAGYSRIVGFEANGGFLTQSDFFASNGTSLSALRTRDSVLPVLLVLQRAVRQNKTISRLVAELPNRPVISDLIREFPVERSKALLAKFSHGGTAYFNREWADKLGMAVKIDETDGVRVTFAQDAILHFRPSGNAPEFRIYVESNSEKSAAELCGLAKDWIIKLSCL